jgi:hypothetical protein
MNLAKIFGGCQVELEAHCDSIAKASTGDVHVIASLLLRMIICYYADVRRQAILAFLAALGLEAIAVGFFFFSIVRVMDEGIDFNILGIVAGALVQVMTAVVFYLYSQTARQFWAFHICLERTNRFLLANAIVGSLPEAEKAAKRSEIISTMLNAPMLTMALIEKGQVSTQDGAS